METYRIVYAPSAVEDLEEITAWLDLHAPEKVSEWLSAIKAQIGTLDTLPERCPKAPENGLWGKEELHQLLFQAYPSKYRIIYTIEPRDNTVRILNIRHGARRYLHE